MREGNKLLPRISLAVAVGAFLVSFALSFQSLGLHQGLSIGDKALDDARAEWHVGEKIKFSVDGTETYEKLSSHYGYISFLFFIAAVSSFGWVLFWKERPLQLFVNIANCVTCILVLYDLRNLIRDKQIVEDSFWDAPRNAFAKFTITYDWALVLLLLIMLGIQATAIISRLRNAGAISR